MVPDRIEREIVIDAPVDVVWSVITEPDQMNAWFTDDVELKVAPGGTGTFAWNRQDAERKVVAVHVEQIDRPRYFSFRWNFPLDAQPTDHNAPLVEFTLTPDGQQTHLRLVESGMSELDRPEGEKANYVTEHTAGWDHLLPRLAEHATSRRGATA